LSSRLVTLTVERNAARVFPSGDAGHHDIVSHVSAKPRARRSSVAAPPPEPYSPAFLSRKVVAIIVSLGLLIGAVYGQTASFDFVDLDDPLYVTENPTVVAGISPETAQWALTAGRAANWHPMTWWSHQLDVTMFGVDAGAMHLVNVAWHTLATLLLFGLLLDMTGAVWRSAWVAALFAVHPAHVESVAWIAERKDVLSTAFWFLTTWVWLRHTRRPRATTYGVVLVCFALGLASKPMLVSLPLTLLLLDVWPFRRLGLGVRALILEKLPLFALAAASSVITVIVQRQGGAVSGLDQLPMADRLSNAVVAYTLYLWHLVWPVHLAVFYPYNPSLEPMAVVGAAVLLVAVSAATWSRRRTEPWLGVGWAWFVVTMIPVIGVVQVGTQAMADRYTYVPYVGLCMAIAWAAQSPARSETRTRVLAALALSAVVTAAWLAHAQVATWRNAETLWRHAVAVRPDSARSHNSLGAIYGNLGRHADAAHHFKEALRLRTDGVDERHIVPNLAHALLNQGRAAEAVPLFRQAIVHAPQRPELHHGLGLALIAGNDTTEAIAAWREAVRLNPDAEQTWSVLGLTLASEGRFAEARSAYAEVVRINPANAEAQRLLKMLGGR
jgi:Flp pilus assembly protein TadD